MIKEQITTRKFVPGEPSTLLDHTQAMNIVAKSFLETDFASYIHLGELDMEGLYQLCNNLDVVGKHLQAGTFGDQPSSTPPSMWFLSSPKLFDV